VAQEALFVYGTLAPGHERWQMIADLIGDVTPAQTAGALYDPGSGWPAARFDDVGGPVYGHLLVPAGSGAAAELYRRCDRIEGVPRLFIRTTVRVDIAGQPCWAVSYAWPDDATTPGRRLPDGRWPS
jgi:gamma-glutamylcyclotransferase (GGCT)/AIG2-like uncharacterized protein YtfP